MVHIENVTVLFGSKPAQALALLDEGHDRETITERTGQVLGVIDATLTIDAGTICVLMGLSGSGKSTLVRCINALYRPARGRVRIDYGGTLFDLNACSQVELRALRKERIAMVFQKFGLFPWRTVRENVGFGLEIRGASKQAISKAVDEKLELVHLSEWADYRIAELSGGMQQRVGLARALATDADILLLDEPFSALDPIIRARLQDELLDIQQHIKKTMIFVSHDLDEALKLGNQIAVMDQGRIVQSGTRDAIMLEPANDYVAQFVSSMNPLNVLRAENVMSSMETLPREGERILLSAYPRMELITDDDGRPVRAMRESDAMPIIALSAFDESKADTTVIVTAPPDTPLRAILNVRHQTGAPIVLVSDGRAVGVIGEREILRALTGPGQTGAATH
jgi:glycine betaine/proline transport system ATP-binding protein